MFGEFNFMEGLVLFLVVALFFKEVASKWISKQFGLGKDEETPIWAQSLIQYTNHDTTKMHEKTHEILEKLVDVVKDHSQKVTEMKEYGVKCRKET